MTYQPLLILSDLIPKIVNDRRSSAVQNTKVLVNYPSISGYIVRGTISPLRFRLCLLAGQELNKCSFVAKYVQFCRFTVYTKNQNCKKEHTFPFNAISGGSEIKKYYHTSPLIVGKCH